MAAHTRRNSTEVDKTCLVPKCTALYFITNNVLNIYSKSHSEKKKVLPTETCPENKKKS